jgi:uncharacterized membrane protein YdjX (TVP38/TMEM64 family)
MAVANVPTSDICLGTASPPTQVFRSATTGIYLAARRGSRVRLFASPDRGRRVLVHLLVLVGLLVATTLALRVFVPELSDPTALRAAILATGPLAPLAYVVVLAVQVVVAPVPGHVLGFVGGYLFGPLLGTLYSLVGVTAGSTVVFVLSRRYGRDYVERMLAPELVSQFDALVAESGTVGLFLIFLIPGLPDDAVCFLAGLTRLPLRRLVVLVAVGRAPAFALVSLAGGGVAVGDYERVFLVLGVFAALSLGGYLARDRLLAALERRVA